MDVQTLHGIRNAGNAVLSFVHPTFPRFPLRLPLPINKVPFSNLQDGTQMGYRVAVDDITTTNRCQQKRETISRTTT